MLKLWHCFVVALTISSAWVGITQAGEMLTPKTIIEKLEISDNCPREHIKKKVPKAEFDIIGDYERLRQRCDEVTAVFAGNNIRLRKIIIEEGVTEYLEGIKIIALPPPEDKNVKAWSSVSYEVHTPSETPSVWREVKIPNGYKEKQHIYFVFTVKMLVPTNKLNEFINGYFAKPLRNYEGGVSYQIFRMRNDKKMIPIEDFTQGAKVFYVEIKVDVTKIDGTQLPSP